MHPHTAMLLVQYESHREIDLEFDARDALGHGILKTLAGRRAENGHWCDGLAVSRTSIATIIYPRHRLYD